VPLRAFTTDALLTELVRRRNAEEVAEPVDHWCEDCRHFKFAKRDDDAYNPCQKKHVMLFLMPEDFPSYDMGHYRRVCADRAPRPAPPAPLPELPATHMETIELLSANSPRAPRGSKPAAVPSGKSPADPC
jgi:hypothetical protein